jgi:hypothetical protein
MNWLLIISNLVILAALIYFFKQNATKQKDLERFSKIVDIDAEHTRLQKETEKLSKDIDKKQKSFDEQCAKKENELTEKLDKTKQSSQRELERLNQNVSALMTRHQLLKTEVNLLEESADLQSFGFYKPHYDFDSSEKYKEQIGIVKEKQKKMIQGKRAAICSTVWTVEGSKAKGQKMTNDSIKLMLRAFNGECDAAIAKVRYNNALSLEARINKAFDVLNKLGAVNQCEIVGQYLRLKIEELRLVHEHHEKRQEEKEEQRQIKEQMAEEKRAQKEYEKAIRDAEKRELTYRDALDKARLDLEIAQSTGKALTKMEQKIAELEEQLRLAEDSMQRAISQAQLTRAGHVYVISNIGSFGDNIYKIGLTRRLEPMDRVKELGDASVPFPFDVHAMIYSEDAPLLENQLHKHFANRRLNLINNRKEYFHASLDEIEKVVNDNHAKITFTKLAEANEYRQSLSYARDEGLKDIFTVLDSKSSSQRVLEPSLS